MLAAFFGAAARREPAAAYAPPIPPGANLVRVQLLLPATPIVVLLADTRRLLVALALAAAFAAPSRTPTAAAATRASTARTAWLPVLAFLQRHEGPNFRVEVVPLAEHWEGRRRPVRLRARPAAARALDLAQTVSPHGSNLGALSNRSGRGVLASATSAAACRPQLAAAP